MVEKEKLGQRTSILKTLNILLINSPLFDFSTIRKLHQPLILTSSNWTRTPTFTSKPNSKWIKPKPTQKDP